MSNITFTQASEKASPTTADEIPIWDVAAGQAKKATINAILNTRLTGGGSVATGGFTLTVGANSTVNGSLVGNISGGGTIATGGFTLTLGGNSAINGNITGGGTLDTGGFTLTVPATGTAALLGAANTFTQNQTVNAMVTAQHFRSRADAIGDDSVVSFTPNSNIGVMIFTATTFGGSVSGIIAYRALSSGHCTILTGGANLESSTSVLTGTTGNDGKVTVSATADGTIYIENRMGSTLSARLTLLS